MEIVGFSVETFTLYTNDPRQPVVTLTLGANVAALPEFIKRILNANLASGETVGAFNFWPTAKPEISVARNTRTSVSIRIRPNSGEAAELKLASKDSEAANVKLRKEADGKIYWLDIETEPVAEPGLKTVKIDLQGLSPQAEAVSVSLTLRVLDDSIVFTPAVIDGGEVARTELAKYAMRVGRAGIRKSAGAFHVKTVSATLDFLKPEVQTIVDGSNYLITVNTVAGRVPKAGAYEGKVVIETDDAQKPRVEIPIKIVLSDK